MIGVHHDKWPEVDQARTFAGPRVSQEEAFHDDPAISGAGLDHIEVVSATYIVIILQLPFEIPVFHPGEVMLEVDEPVRGQCWIPFQNKCFHCLSRFLRKGKRVI